MNQIPQRPIVALVVFAARESLPDLLQTLHAAQVAAKRFERAVRIEVLINGNTPLLNALVSRVSAEPSEFGDCSLRIWSLKVGDKAHAWNQYNHHIHADEELSFFIDGYVRLFPDAMKLLGNAVLASPHALGGSGVPTTGRTAKALRAGMLKHGGFHGNFCCIKGCVLQTLRDRQFHIPVGMYRTDSLMGAVLSFNLDPAANQWDPTRILVHPEASWLTNPKYVWSIADVWAKVKRTRRQARGVLENQAVREHLEVQRQLPEKLPICVKSLITGWMASNKKAIKHLMLLRPLTILAARDIRNLPELHTLKDWPIKYWPISKEKIYE